MKDYSNCNDCEHISITEEEQEKLQYPPQHECKLASFTIYHVGHHPILPTPKWCPLLKTK